MRAQRSLALIVVLSLSVLLLPDRAGTSTRSGSTALGDTRPNIVLVLTDDMRWDELENMPKTKAFLAAGGARFTQAYVSNSLCCPSRTSTLTGQYSSNNGVWRNAAPYGGFRAFAY